MLSFQILASIYAKELNILNSNLAKGEFILNFIVHIIQQNSKCKNSKIRTKFSRKCLQPKFF